MSLSQEQIDQLQEQLKATLDEFMRGARSDLADLQPDIERIARTATAWGLQAALGDPEAGKILQQLWQQTQDLATILVRRESGRFAQQFDVVVTYLAKFLGEVLKALI